VVRLIVGLKVIGLDVVCPKLRVIVVGDKVRVCGARGGGG